MASKRIKWGLTAALLLAAAGAATAGNFASDREIDYFAKGTHRFYVWCAGANNYTATATANSAEEAQMRIYNDAKAAGHSTCWPVWQGRVAG